ncbi:DUF2663 family protein [Paenibacillus antri]|nr:DUF2663 family protein [Paenibacillus antri]
MSWHGLEVSEDTGRMLDELTKRKAKWDGAKNQLLLFCLIFAACSAFSFIAFQRFVSPMIKNPFDVLGLTIGDQRVYLPLLCSIASGFHTMQLTKKVNEYKLKYEVLRKEAITHLDTTWIANPKSELRDRVTEIMHKKGVNVNYYGK